MDVSINRRYTSGKNQTLIEGIHVLHVLKDLLKECGNEHNKTGIITHRSSNNNIIVTILSFQNFLICILIIIIITDKKATNVL